MISGEKIIGKQAFSSLRNEKNEVGLAATHRGFIFDSRRKLTCQVKAASVIQLKEREDGRKR